MTPPETYEIPPITAVSPSLAEALRNCPLQAGLSRIVGVRAFVLGNPKAWLGTAYHKVLEQLWDTSPLGDDIRIQELWKHAVLTLQERACAHPLDKRFAKAEKWPGYHLIRCFTELRAQQALRDKPRQSNTEPSGVLLEHNFTALNGKLIGKPDVISGNEIRDYKSGRIYDETPDGKKNLKQAYVRQLRLYGYLVQEHLGYCPKKGILLPMQGEPVEVSLNPHTCFVEAADAVALLDDYNKQIQTAERVWNLASPSARACRWCQYKTLCPAFWRDVSESWAEDLGSACVRGKITSTPESIHNGKALAMTIVDSTGTTTASPLVLAPLENTVHAQIATWQPGDVVRVINLYRRGDGRLAPTTSMVCLREQELPTFA